MIAALVVLAGFVVNEPARRPPCARAGERVRVIGGRFSRFVVVRRCERPKRKEHG